MPRPGGPLDCQLDDVMLELQLTQCTGTAGTRNDVRLLELEEDAERAASEEEVARVEHEAVLGFGDGQLGHVRECGHSSRLVRENLGGKCRTKLQSQQHIL
jgi:hypothetical protein